MIDPIRQINTGDAISMDRRQLEWQNAKIFQINKQPARCSSRSYSSKHDALNGQDEKRTICLDGEWAFYWVATPKKRIEDFYQLSYDDSAWQVITVPSQWELHGYGVPIYAPFHMPPSLRKQSMPNIDPDDNPVGAYRRHFTLPKSWKDQKVFIQFDGVCSAFYLWINGEIVGYSQDSMLPAEFNISPFLKEGDNLIAVEVYRFSDGSYLEDQDMWFLSGIFRSVHLIAVPDVHIRDFSLRSKFNIGFDKAELKVELEIRQLTLSQREAQSYKILVELQDDTGALINKVEKVVAPMSADSTRVEAMIPVQQPHLWSAEIPYLYDVLITLMNTEGKVLEVRHARHGFREIKIQDRQLFVNGQSIILKGINRHDFDPKTGHTMTLERLREDVVLMKQNNINALRTSHYPQDERLYELCDELGLYVMDEANIETHGFRDSMKGDLQWREAMMDRVQRMIQRDRNHPCNIMWSLGNESSSDIKFAELTDLCHQMDPERPVHYEQDYRGEYVDVFSMMYPTPMDLETIAKGGDYTWRSGILGWDRIYGKDASEKPLILCEYAHSMGNSLGNFEKYIHLFEKYPQIVGGFIWDFADQSILSKTEDGLDFWAMGGDLGDPYNFKMFGCNGIFSADRTPHPAAWQVKKGYQEVSIEAIDLIAGRFCVKNKYCFRDLSFLKPVWRLEIEGELVQSGELEPIVLTPSNTTEIIIPYQLENLTSVGEAILTISFILQQNQSWAPAGFELAWEQFVLSNPNQKKAKIPGRTMPDLKILEQGSVVEVSGEDFSVFFDSETGYLQQVRKKGQDLLVSPIKPNLWRPFIDNEIAHKVLYKIARWVYRGHPWRKATENIQPKDFSIQEIGQGYVQVSSAWKIPFGQTPFISTFTIWGDGSINVNSAFTPNRELERMGMQMQLVPHLKNVTWFGRGPFETMPDRKTGAKIGKFTQKVQEMPHYYVRPQENGNRSDVRWFNLFDKDKEGLKISASGESLINFSVWPCYQEDWEESSHIHEIPKRDLITLNIDYLQRGVGGDIPAGGNPHEEYLLKKGVEYRYQFEIQLLEPKATIN